MQLSNEVVMKRAKQEAVIEAILFSIGDAVSISTLAEIVEAKPSEVKKIVYAMKEKMDAEDRGVTITELNDSFQMCSKAEMYDYLIDITKKDRKYTLTDTVLETLSIIAYKQPVTRADIEKIRGVDCSHAVNKLIELDLVKELGRMDAPGRPILFGTTEQFLRSFGVKSLEDLPEMSQVQREEFREQAEAEVQLQLNI